MNKLTPIEYLKYSGKVRIAFVTSCNFVVEIVLDESTRECIDSTFKLDSNPQKKLYRAAVNVLDSLNGVTV